MKGKKEGRNKRKEKKDIFVDKKASKTIERRKCRRKNRNKKEGELQ